MPHVTFGTHKKPLRNCSLLGAPPLARGRRTSWQYRRHPYCWWKKSCTREVKTPVNNGINYQPQLVARMSEPSTVPGLFLILIFVVLVVVLPSSSLCILSMPARGLTHAASHCSTGNFVERFVLTQPNTSVTTIHVAFPTVHGSKIRRENHLGCITRCK